MNDRGLMILTAMVGGALGAGLGYLLFTREGRRLRAELRPELENLVTEAVRLGQIVDDVRHGRPASAGPAPARSAAGPRRTP